MKATKAAAHYRKATVRGENCHTCRHRVDHGEKPSTCRLVEGYVERGDVCDLFDPPLKESLLEAYAAGWALVEDAPEPSLPNLADLVALDGLAIESALTAGERSARRATLERARLRAYRRESKKTTAAAVALLLAHVPVDHLATVLVLMGNQTATKRQRADQANHVLSAAMWSAPSALMAWRNANRNAWAVAVARGRAEAEASSEAGPPLPRQVAKLAGRNEGFLTDEPAPDWTSKQLARMAWQLSSDDLWQHEDPAEAIRRSIEDGDPIAATTEDLMHEALSRAFVDWFATGPGTNLGLLAWVTEGDSRVCPECDFLEADGPYQPADAPEMPAHPSCRCHFERE